MRVLQCSAGPQLVFREVDGSAGDTMASELETTNREATQRIWELIENDDLEGLDEVYMKTSS